MNVCDQTINGIVYNQHAYPGWCWFEKARAMVDLILQTSPQLVVEIGVFGGASFFPQVEAIKANGNRALIIGIEPFSNNAAIQGQTNENSEWWQKIDFNDIRKKVYESRNRHHAESCSVILDWTSLEAFEAFRLLSFGKPIDILHIDGNHATESALFDVVAWTPLVRDNGYVWFDDANWDSVQPAIAELEKTFTRIKDVPNKEGTQLVSLFQKNK